MSLGRERGGVWKEAHFCFIALKHRPLGRGQSHPLGVLMEAKGPLLEHTLAQVIGCRCPGLMTLKLKLTGPHLPNCPGATDLSKCKSGHMAPPLGLPPPHSSPSHWVRGKHPASSRQPLRGPPLSPTPSLPMAHLAPAKPTRHSPAPGPLHRLCPMPRPLALISTWLNPCHSNFTQKPPERISLSTPHLFSLVPRLPQWTVGPPTYPQAQHGPWHGAGGGKGQQGNNCSSVTGPLPAPGC